MDSVAIQLQKEQLIFGTGDGVRYDSICNMREL